MIKQIRRIDPPSKVLQDLKGKTLGQLSIDDYNEFVDNAFIEESSLKFISDLAAIMKFQERPRGLQLVKAEQSSGVSSSSYTTLLTIPKDKTFDIQAVVMIATATSDSVINYALELDGLEYLLKTVEYTHPSFGITVDFSTMGDFLISGSSTTSSALVANRRSGSGSVIHNVFYREVN